MKITHYLYNCFLIKTSDKTIAIDSGALMFYFFRMSSLIPKSEWSDITHILITHGDPDHYWHADRVAKASGAKVICNRTMLKNIDGKDLALAPRKGGLVFNTEFENLETLDLEKGIDTGGMNISGLKTTHGPLLLKFGPFSKLVEPGPEERVGWGSIGYRIQVDGKEIVNLGDTLLELEAWETVNNPDVLMIPIGGREIGNTMDEDQALQAVEQMKPKLVIPCHYNCPAFFSKTYNPADVEMFKREVIRMGLQCEILNCGESIDI